MATSWRQVITRVMPLVIGTLVTSCGGNSVTGTVGDTNFEEVRGGFYTEFEFASGNETETWWAIVLTDLEDPCDKFSSVPPQVGSAYVVLQLWLTRPDVQEYPIYSVDHLSEVDGDIDYSLAYYTAVINSKKVVNSDGVAGVVKVSDYDSEDDQLVGSMDVIFSGNGNRLQGAYSLDYCKIAWANVADEILYGD